MDILGFGTGISTLYAGSDLTGLSGSLLNKAPYAQESVRVENTMVAGSLALGLGDSHTSLWIAANVYHDNTDWILTDLIVVKDNVGTPWFKLIANTDKTYKIAYWNGASWVESSNSFYTDTSLLHRIDLEYGTDAVRLYVDAVLEAEMVTTINTPTANLLTAELYNPHTAAGSFSYWSSVFASDVSSRRTVMNQHSLLADGVLHNDFIGTYDDVNDFATLGEDTKIVTETGNTLQTFQKSNVPSELASGYILQTVGMYMRVYEDSDVVSSIQTVMTDGTNEKLGTLTQTPNEYTTIKQIEPLDNTGAAWTVPQLDSLEVGIKCVI